MRSAENGIGKRLAESDDDQDSNDAPRLTLAVRSSDKTRLMTAPTINLGLISEGVHALPLYAAQSKQLFEREGISVDVRVTGSSARQLEDLVRGTFQIGFQQSDHVVRAVERGADLFVVMAQAHAPELTLVGAPEVHDCAALKGRDIAVDGVGTGYALLLRRLLEREGLRDGDYACRQTGGSRERYESLKSGATSASLLNAPFDRNLLASGFNRLASVSEYFPGYPGSIAAASRAWAQRNRPRLVAFIRAFIAGWDWLRCPANKTEAVELLATRLDIDREAAAREYDALARSPPPSVTAEGLRQVIDIVWQAEAWPGAPAAPDKYLDLSYLHEASQPHAATQT